MEEEDKIVLRSEEVNEVLTTTPPWLLRWGITVLFAIIVLGVLLSYFISYPDTLDATATITSLNPPVSLVSKTNGSLTKLLVKNNETVKQSQVLAVLENTCNYEDALTIETEVNKLNNQLKLSDSLPEFSFNQNANLGELTTAYLTFLKSYKDLKLFTEVNPQQQEITILNKELTHYSSLLQNYQQQLTIYTEQFSLTEKDYNRDLNLFQSKAISQRELEAKRRELLAAQNNLEGHKVSITNSRITINNIEKNILQLKIDYLEKISRFKTDVVQNIKSLNAQISDWKQRYLLISPTEGRVSFFNVWTENQVIKQGDHVFSVIPDHKQQLVARLKLPASNTGKLKLNQEVNIKLDDYPFTEYGIIRGKVSAVSSVPNDKVYLVEVQLSDGLKTSYNKELEYKEEMSGTAEVITSNASVMDRIFFTFRKMAGRG